MGMDLCGPYSTVSMSHSGWAEVLGCARSFGWNPQPDVHYYTNDWDYVTPADATALADALDIALKTELRPALRRLEATPEPGVPIFPLDPLLHEREELAVMVILVESVIRLCWQGGFYIG